MKVLVLDTSAFIMGFDPSVKEEAYTVYSVERELLEGTTPYLRLQASKQSGTLSLRHPTIQSSKMVDRALAETGDEGRLSQADQDVLALALDLRDSGRSPLIVSDDYSVQNLAEHLGMDYRSLANFGIVHKFEWIMYCPACHRRYGSTERKCPVCGTDLRRKVLRKTRVTD